MLTNPLQAFLGAHYGYRQALISSQLRSAVTAVVFRKALAVNAAVLAATGSGRVQVGWQAVGWMGWQAGWRRAVGRAWHQQQPQQSTSL